MLGPFRWLLCDADGNLFPSEEPAFVASAEVTNAFLSWGGADVRFTPDELRVQTTGKNFRTTMSALADRYGIEMSQADQEHWVARERQAVTGYLAKSLKPDSGVLEPLRRLDTAMELAAVSSSASSRLAVCFDATELAGLFPPSRRFSAEDSLDVPTSKPDPAIYRFACERLGAVPADALAIEDSVPGAESALRAGLPTVGNVQFVPLAEREERIADLRELGVIEVVTSWSELDRLLR